MMDKTAIALPKAGDKVYVPSSIYLSRGADDVAGGLATIKRVIVYDDLPDGHMNKVFIQIEEHPRSNYNWNYIRDNQQQWAQEYAGQLAHPDPDHREEFNRGD